METLVLPMGFGLHKHEVTTFIYQPYNLFLMKDFFEKKCHLLGEFFFLQTILVGMVK